IGDMPGAQTAGICRAAVFDSGTRLNLRVAVDLRSKQALVGFEGHDPEVNKAFVVTNNGITFNKPEDTPGDDMAFLTVRVKVTDTNAEIVMGGPYKDSIEFRRQLCERQNLPLPTDDNMLLLELTQAEFVPIIEWVVKEHPSIGWYAPKE